MKLFWNAWAVATIFAAGCSAGDSTFTAQVEARPATFNVAGDPTVDLSVPDMMCEDSCAKKVHEILSEQPGAKDVSVDFPARIAHVAIDRHTFDAEAAISALEDHGFSQSKVAQPPQRGSVAPIDARTPKS